MSLTISDALQRIKADVAHWLTPNALRTACEAVGHKWRDRVFDPVATVHLFLLQVLNGNAPCAEVVRLGHVRCSPEAYGQARNRLPVALPRLPVNRVCDRLPGRADGRWRGHLIFLLDGTSLSMPDAPARQKRYGQPGAQKPGCGFPVMHV